MCIADKDIRALRFRNAVCPMVLFSMFSQRDPFWYRSVRVCFWHGSIHECVPLQSKIIKPLVWMLRFQVCSNCGSNMNPANKTLMHLSRFYSCSPVYIIFCKSKQNKLNQNYLKRKKEKYITKFIKLFGKKLTKVETLLLPSHICFPHQIEYSSLWCRWSA